jgi:alanyl-tRNA synthetase
MFTKDVDRASYVDWIPATKFVWYEQFESEWKLLKRIDLQDYSVLIFDQTPFYPEWWWQTWDKWSIIMDDWQVKTVFDVKKYVDIILHFIK